MSDLYNRISKLFGPDAARNIVASSPSEEDDQIQDFHPGNTDFLTSEQIKDAQDFQIAKDQEEQGKALQNYEPASTTPSNAPRTLASNTEGQDLTPEFLQQYQNSVNFSPEVNYTPGMFSGKQPTLEDHNDINQALAQQTNSFAPSQQIQQGGPGGPFGVLHGITQPNAPMPAFDAPVSAPPSPKPIPAQVGPSPKPIPTEIGQPEPQGPQSIASLENLLAAQDAARNVRSVNNGARGLDLMSAGIAGLGSNSIVKPSGQQLFKDQAAGADQITNDYKDAVAMEKHDPKSAVSSAMRQFATKFGVDAKALKGLSAQDMEKVMPWLAKAFEGQENRKARHEDLALRLKDFNQRIKERNEDKKALNEEKKTTKEIFEGHKRLEKAGKDIIPGLASSRSAFGRMGNTLRSGGALQALTNGRKLGDIDNREIYEVARGFDSMISGGTGTIEGTSHMVPKTMKTDLAKVQEYWNGKRFPAHAASFIERTMISVAREVEAAQKQIKDVQKQRLAPMRDLFESNHPEIRQGAMDLISAHGIENPFEKKEEKAGESNNSDDDAFDSLK